MVTSWPRGPKDKDNWIKEDLWDMIEQRAMETAGEVTREETKVALRGLRDGAACGPDDLATIALTRRGGSD